MLWSVGDREGEGKALSRIPPNFSWGASLLTRSKIRLLSSVTNAENSSRDTSLASVSTRSLSTIIPRS